jgi:hypothetical protein
MCIPRLLATTLYLTAIYPRIITEWAYSEYSHLFSYHDCMCILSLHPCTLVSLLYVNTQTTATYPCINSVCAYSDYSHVLLYYYCLWIHRLQPPTLVSILYVHTQDYSHPLLYQFCMCILRLQPCTLVSLLYVHTQTTAIHSCTITVYFNCKASYSFKTLKYALSDSCTVQSYKPRQVEIGDPGHSTVHLGTQWTSACEQQQ